MSAGSYTAIVERAIVGAILLEPRASVIAAGRITPEDFSDPVIGLIFETLTALVRTGGEIPDGASAVKTEMARLDTLGRLGDAPDFFIASIVSDPAADPRLVDDRVSAVFEMSQRRKAEILIRDKARGIADRTIPLGDTIGTIRSALTEIEATESKTELTPLSTAIDAVVAQMEAGYIDPGTPTGIDPIDDAIAGGLKPTQLMVIAGATGSGKTSLAMQIALNAAEWAKRQQKGCVLVFSFEMNPDELAIRLVHQVSHFKEGYRPPHGWRRKEDQVLARETMTRIRDLPFLIESEISENVPAIEGVVARHIETHCAPSLVIVDHIGLLNVPNSKAGRTEQVGQITRGIKNLARRYKLPVLALSQLSRDVEKREDHRPVLSDLRESGTIEQDSNIVALVYRPSYYLKDIAVRNAQEEAGAEAHVIIAKNRAGQAADLEFEWVGPRYLFRTPDRYYEQRNFPVDPYGGGAARLTEGASPALGAGGEEVELVSAEDRSAIAAIAAEEAESAPNEAEPDEADLLFGGNG